MIKKVEFEKFSLEIAQLLPIRMNRKRNEPDPWERPSELQKIKNRRNRLEEEMDCVQNIILGVKLGKQKNRIKITS